MNKLICFLCLCSAIIYTAAKKSYCGSDSSFGDLPLTIQEQLLDIIVNGGPAILFGCPPPIVPVPEDSIKFYLFSRTVSFVPLDRNKPIQIDPSKPIIVLIHGWLCSIKDSGFPTMIAAYLNRYDCNIIGVDWSDLSVDDLSEAYCSVPTVGEKLGNLLCNIKELFGVSLEISVHVVGHSMGAQVGGFAGQRTKDKCCSTIGRITGLDPAGSFYQLDSPSERLDEGDANFVDVIHTNMGFLAYEGPCGTIDFLSNCGKFQPGCTTFLPGTTTAELSHLLLTKVACSHFRAVDYHTESIRSDKFKSTSCATPYDGLLCIPNTFIPSYAIMGEDSLSQNPQNHTYCLNTNDQSPYAKGYFDMIN